MKIHIFHKAKFPLVLVFVTIFSTTIQQLQACDVCGCAAGGSMLGILPQYGKNFVGMRFRYQQFTHPTLLTEFKDDAVSSEYFISPEIWGRWYPHKRVQILYFLPYVHNIRQEVGGNSTSAGIGDVSFLANYLLINTGDSLFAKKKHTLLFGGGIKAATGSIERRSRSKLLLPAHFQPGTGSYAFILNGIYTMRSKKYGINAEASYRTFTTNQFDYKFGDRVSSSLSGFLWLENKKRVLMPNLSIIYEKLAKDKEYRDLLQNSGAQSLFGSLGIDIYKKKWITGINFQYPIAAQTNGTLPLPDFRMMAHLEWIF
jgi:hypothetical protein